jgi:hypothetical protein
MGAKGVDAAAMESVVYHTQLAIKLFRGADMGARGVDAAGLEVAGSALSTCWVCREHVT